MRPLLRYVTQGHWMMEQSTMARFAEVMNRHLAGSKLSRGEVTQAIGRDPDEAHPSNLTYQVQAGVALVPVRGVIAKYSSDVNGVSQPEGTSAEAIQAQLRAAATDPAVRAVVLAIDSPGGMVAGTPDTAALVAEMAKAMPVVAHIEDLGASAAYYLASQASAIFANANAMVGSLGVISKLIDSSEAARKEGIRVTVIRSVAMKAPGQFGEAVTKEQIAEKTREIASLHALFSSAVQTGRGFDAAQLAAVMTGQCWIASDALALGLVDGICSLSNLVDQLAGARRR